jgi:serine/threonine-protein kinase
MALPNSNKRKIFDGRYEVISIVGRGTDSVVYHARHAASPTQEVALKVLLSQKEKTSVTERLRKEALTLVSCRHRYVVRLDDFHSIGDLCYLSMEYAQAGDLRKYLNQRGAPLNAEISERFLRQTLEALDFVHARIQVHVIAHEQRFLFLNILVFEEKPIVLH